MENIRTMSRRNHPSLNRKGAWIVNALIICDVLAYHLEADSRRTSSIFQAQAFWSLVTEKFHLGHLF
jgi:hypothetical protein